MAYIAIASGSQNGFTINEEGRIRSVCVGQDSSKRRANPLNIQQDD